jgi:Putative zinc-finger
MNEQTQPLSSNACLDPGRLTAWRDGELSVPEAEQVRMHLSGCARCTAEAHAVLYSGHEITDLYAMLDPQSEQIPAAAEVLPQLRERLHLQSIFEDENRHFFEHLFANGRFVKSRIPSTDSEPVKGK